jgi:hypothetical protein
MTDCGIPVRNIRPVPDMKREDRPESRRAVFHA